MAVDDLRKAEKALIAFETEHPTIAPEPVPVGKHALPQPQPELAPRTTCSLTVLVKAQRLTSSCIFSCDPPVDTHAKKEPHLAGKAAQHRDALLAQRERLRDEVTLSGMVVDCLKTMKEKENLELEDAFLEAYQACEADLGDQPEVLAYIKAQMNRMLEEIENGP